MEILNELELYFGEVHSNCTCQRPAVEAENDIDCLSELHLMMKFETEERHGCQQNNYQFLDTFWNAFNLHIENVITD